MAKTKSKPKENIEGVKLYQVIPLTPFEKKKSMLKPITTLTIEIIEKVGGMEIGTKKTLPTRLANQMVDLGHAKII